PSPPQMEQHHRRRNDLTSNDALQIKNYSCRVGVGFLVTYAGVGGPRTRGLANGLQLFYILPCFPPYDPSALGARLTGLAIGVVLTAAAEVWLLPDPAPGRYADRLVRAASLAAGALRALAAPQRSPHVYDRPERLLEASQELRMDRVPNDERPTSASARDRALCQGADFMRHLLAQTWQLAQDSRDAPLAGDAAASRLLRASATACHDVSRGLSGHGPAPAIAPCTAAAAAFETHRTHPLGPDAGSAAVVRSGAIALDITYTGAFLVTAARIALGAPIPPDATPPAERPGPFWYAGRSALSLYAHRLLSHLTPRSVYLQNAVRIALALAVARLIVGAVDLSHGTWALLATLTVMRTTAAGTRTALRPKLLGVLAGGAAAAPMLYFVDGHAAVYAVVTPPLIFLSYTAGPLVGASWGNAFSTLQATAIFAQLQPTGPELAAVRVADTVTGLLTGALIGLLAWPYGGTRELRRACSRLLDQGTRAVTEITDTITGAGTAGDALPRARLTQQIAEACYAQYATESDDPEAAPASETDWQAIAIAGSRVTITGQTLVKACPPGALAAWPVSAEHLRNAAHHLQLTALPLAEDLHSGTTRDSPAEPPVQGAPTDRMVIADVCAASGGRAPDPLLYYAVDAAIWLASLQRAVMAIRPDPQARAAASG
ncbi:FUSC family protein, partial [Streptomyces mirabilis]|uniref:FUSC family protein n=1 Tax=Streptomyces mirabilis TaxID=68239 RepID=UPI0033A5FD21